MRLQSGLELDLVADPNAATAVGRHENGERRSLRREHLDQRLHDGNVSLPGKRMRVGRKAPGDGIDGAERDVADAQRAAGPTLLAPRIETVDRNIRAKALSVTSGAWPIAAANASTLLRP